MKKIFEYNKKMYLDLLNNRFYWNIIGALYAIGAIASIIIISIGCYFFYGMLPSLTIDIQKYSAFSAKILNFCKHDIFSIIFLCTGFIFFGLCAMSSTCCFFHANVILGKQKFL